MPRQARILTRRITKIGYLLCLIVSFIVPSLVLAQITQTPGPERSSASDRSPGKNANIVSFHIGTEGTLHIVYSDGAEVEVAREKGRFAEGDNILTQESFSDIQLAADRQHIGWLADYMICWQSYPCTAELVIYRHGYKTQYISPPYGIMWKWWFYEGGRKVVAQFGFPHGDDTGAYALYDTKTGRQLAVHYPKKQKKPPLWSQQPRRSNR